MEVAGFFSPLAFVVLLQGFSTLAVIQVPAMAGVLFIVAPPYLAH